MFSLSTGFFLLIFMESSIFHNQLCDSDWAFLCWNTQTSCCTFYVSLLIHEMCTVLFSLYSASLLTIDNHKTANDQWLLNLSLTTCSIAARCRTVLAEYNMSCDDVSTRVLWIALYGLSFSLVYECKVTFLVQTFVFFHSRMLDGETYIETTASYPIAPWRDRSGEYFISSYYSSRLHIGLNAGRLSKVCEGRPPK